MRILTWLLFLLLLCSTAAPRITEIYYDPEGDEYSQEFVEIYGISNLSEYTFGDLYKNQTLTLRKETESEYALIVAEGFNDSNLSVRVYTAGSRLGNGLGNTGDMVFLYFNNTLVDSVAYNSSSTSEGHSLEWDGMQWKASSEKGGTPGRGFATAQNFSIILDTSLNINFTTNCSPLFELYTNKLIYYPYETIHYKITSSEKKFQTTFALKTPYGHVLKREIIQTSHEQTFPIQGNLSAVWLTAEVNLCNRTFHTEKIVAVKTHEKYCPTCPPLPLCPQPAPCPEAAPCPACPEVHCVQEQVPVKNSPPTEPEPLKPVVIQQVLDYDFTKTGYFAVGIVLLFLLTLFVMFRNKSDGPDVS